MSNNISTITGIVFAIERAKAAILAIRAGTGTTSARDRELEHAACMVNRLKTSNHSRSVRTSLAVEFRAEIERVRQLPTEARCTQDGESHCCGNADIDEDNAECHKCARELAAEQGYQWQIASPRERIGRDAYNESLRDAGRGDLVNE